MNTIETHDRKAAKSKLRDVLQAYGGDTKHEAVAAAIEQLISLNPTAAPTRQETVTNGNWVLISAPNFPNGERREDGKYAYTLGRLAFNMFEPMLDEYERADSEWINSVRAKIDAAIAVSEQTLPIDGEPFIAEILERFQQARETQILLR